MEDNLFSIPDLTDSYKLGHFKMYVDGTGKVCSYFESRKGAKFDETVWFGLQQVLKRFLSTKITKEMIDEAEELIYEHMGPDFDWKRERWDYIVQKYDGKLPVRIQAVREGKKIPTGNVLMQITNTDDNCAWLTNHLETVLTHVWYPSTVASLSWQVKKFLMEKLDITCDTGANFAGLGFMLHDFGMRGASTVETAGVGGMAHLTQFMGTDTVIALKYAKKFYGAKKAVGYSVNATEHSIMTSLGPDGEKEMICSLIEKFPNGILSVVSDSFDYKRCVEEYYCKLFKSDIEARNGKFVVRPDSGDYNELMPWTLETLGKYFGYTVNAKGFKVLNPKVGVIWGDGLDFEAIKEIVLACMLDGWSVENLVFGMGGGLLQKVNRDTQRFAFKCCAQERNGVWYDVYKEPTDKSKASKRGPQKLIVENGKYKTVRDGDEDYAGFENHLVDVYLNGDILIDYTFDEVRNA